MRRWTAITLLLLPSLPEAQDGSLWRHFTSASGLPHSSLRTVSPSPREGVWLTHDEIPSITRYDGYTFETLDFPGGPHCRIREGNSGQLWAVGKEGIHVRTRDRWQHFAPPVVLQEYQRNVWRLTHPVSVVPLRIHQALILLSDRLLRFDATTRAIRILKRSDDTTLDTFRDMIELSDGTLCITGKRGIAFIEAPARTIGPDIPWREMASPSDLRSFQSPRENPDGSVSVIGIGPDGRRELATVTPEGWHLRNLGRIRIRHGWKDAGEGWWGLTYHDVYRIGRDSSIRRLDGPAGLYADVAASSPDIFLVVGPEGLQRHAPSCWQEPETLSGSPVHAIHEDDRGHLWFLGTQALLERSPSGWKTHPWPEDLELLFSTPGRLHQLDNGTLLIDSQDAVLAFDPETRSFSPLPHIVRILGATLPGHPLVSTARHPVAILRDDSLQPLSLEGLPDPARIRFLAETGQFGMLVGDAEGLGRIREGTFRRFVPEEGLSPGPATSLLELDDGRLWASAGGSIHEYDGKRWTLVHQHRDRIHAMIRTSDGSVWVAGNQGLVRFHRDSWVQLDARDGLGASTVYSILEDRSQNIWIATPRGIRLHVPEADVDPPRSELVIRENKAHFSARDKWDLTPRERILFSWRLDHGPWSPYATQRELELPDGSHRLELRAMDRNGNEEPDPSVREYTLVLPWHRDPRLLLISCLALVLVAVLSALAVNRHLRLIRSHAEVEREIAHRTRELDAANRELLQTQKMRALGTLSAGIAHDFNGILSIIRGSTQIIEANLEDRGKVLTRLDRIRKVVDQGSGVIRSLLGLASSGRTPPGPTRIARILRTTSQLMEPPPVRYRCAPDLPPVTTSPDLLQQILINLLANAREALPSGGTVTLEAVAIDTLPSDLVIKPSSAPGWIRITVQDTGGGIPPEILPRIFEPFYSRRSLSSRRGTGLGLFMVYEMARELQAGLAVSSRQGEGSAFHIFLPLTPSPDREIPTHTRQG